MIVVLVDDVVQEGVQFFIIQIIVRKILDCIEH